MYFGLHTTSTSQPGVSTQSEWDSQPGGTVIVGVVRVVGGEADGSSFAQPAQGEHSGDDADEPWHERHQMYAAGPADRNRI
jgi:hypothetical protein